MKNWDKEWRQFLWETYEITPESKYMNINELETLMTLRGEFKREYKPISYLEYVEHIYENGIIPKHIQKLKLQ